MIPGIGEGIAFAGLVFAVAVMEIRGADTGNLWWFAVFWFLFTDWGERAYVKAHQAKPTTPAIEQAEGPE